MALKKCPDCKGQVSSSADRCPHCGRPIDCGPLELMGQQGLLVRLLVFGFAIGVGVVVFWLLAR